MGRIPAIVAELPPREAPQSDVHALAPTRDDVTERKRLVLLALDAGDERRAMLLASGLADAQAHARRPDLAAKTLCDLARAAERARAPGLAEQWLERARAFEPDDPFVWSQLVGLLGRQRREGERLRLSASMIARFPDNVAVMVTRATALSASGWLDEAAVVFARAVTRFPYNAHAHLGRAALLQKLGRLDEALVAYEEATRRFPSDPIALNGVGSVLRTRGELTRARDVFTAAVAAHPGNPFAYARLAETLVRLGRLEEALAVCDAYDERFSSSLPGLRMRVRGLLAWGAPLAALDATMQFRSVAAEEPSVLELQAECLAECGADAEAVRTYELLRDRFGRPSPPVRAAHALACLRLGKPSEVHALLSSLASAESRRATAKESILDFARARLLIAMGDLNGAERALVEGAGRTALGEPLARFAFARAVVRWMRGDAGGAIEHLRGVPAIEGEAPDVARALVEGLASGDHRAGIPRALASPLRYRAIRSLSPEAEPAEVASAVLAVAAL